MRLWCGECGEEAWVEDSGVSHHYGDTIDDIDYDLDADHVAVPYDEDGQPWDG